MKIFLSFKYTGESLVELNKMIPSVFNSLKTNGNNVFCTFFKEDFFEEKRYTYKQILHYALNEIDKSDVVFVFLNSEDKSEGMLLEIGYSIANNKKIILAKRKNVKTTFVEEFSSEIIEFESVPDLCTKINNISLN